MAGTPEEDLLGWLEREEESLGFGSVADGLQDIDAARQLFYDELRYDMTPSQFLALREASSLRYEQLPSIGIDYNRVERSWGYQDTYRDIISGKFISRDDVFSMLSTIRSL